jgi:hypothetical protein
MSAKRDPNVLLPRPHAHHSALTCCVCHQDHGGPSADESDLSAKLQQLLTQERDTHVRAAPLTVVNTPHTGLPLVLIGVTVRALQAETMNDLQARHAPSRAVSAPPPQRLLSTSTAAEGLLTRCAAACRTHTEPTLILHLHLSRRSAIHTLHLELHPAVFGLTCNSRWSVRPMTTRRRSSSSYSSGSRSADRIMMRAHNAHRRCVAVAPCCPHAPPPSPNWHIR